MCEWMRATRINASDVQRLRRLFGTRRLDNNVFAATYRWLFVGSCGCFGCESRRSHCAGDTSLPRIHKTCTHTLLSSAQGLCVPRLPCNKRSKDCIGGDPAKHTHTHEGQTCECAACCQSLSAYSIFACRLSTGSCDRHTNIYIPTHSLTHTLTHSLTHSRQWSQPIHGPIHVSAAGGDRVWVGLQLRGEVS